MKITPSTDAGAVPSKANLERALQKLKSLYKDILKALVRETVMYDKEQFTQREADRAVEPVKTCEAIVCDIDTETHGEIDVIGTVTDVTEAAGFIRKYLNLAKPEAGKQHKGKMQR